MTDYILEWCNKCDRLTWHCYTDYTGYGCREEPM